MSLYNEAATLLETKGSKEGSLRSQIFNNSRTYKSKPALLYALISEVTKWDCVLKEVVENANLLQLEPKLTPLISVLVVHDLLISKHGVAAKQSHPLRVAVEKHKTRLQAELTRIRIRRHCTTLEALREKLEVEYGAQNPSKNKVQWVRINTLRAEVRKQLETTFEDFEQAKQLSELLETSNTKRYYVDKHVPNLLAFPASADITKTLPYRQGEIILQDKASCFPAYLLLASTTRTHGDILDACAAPGNKTTHLAMLADPSPKPFQIFACERDLHRSKTLSDMVHLACADKQVKVLPKQDFLVLNPNDGRFANVTHILLDPSCSGSGIVRRADIPDLKLPYAPEKAQIGSAGREASRKRKRGFLGDDASQPNTRPLSQSDGISDKLFDEVRLQKLSNLQTRIIEHAFSFPAATHISYSTCSIHVVENEGVVARALTSHQGKNGQWRVVPKNEQPSRLKAWLTRGLPGDHGLTAKEIEGCIRCFPHDEQATIGFFVCLLAKGEAARPLKSSPSQVELYDNSHKYGSEDDWEGFDDNI
ncbi:MAG: hypothetical protein Q9227_003953 [Pyrenula ochraceoflavens]